MRGQLVGTRKNVDLFIYLGVTFSKVMHSFIIRNVVSIFPGKFSNFPAWKDHRLFVSSSKVKFLVPDKFGENV